MTKRTSEEIIVGMYNDLKKYSQQKTANPAAVKLKEQFIDEIKEAFEQKDTWIEQLENDAEKFIREMTSLKNKIVKLEAICLIHGITDLPVWMGKDIGALVDDVRFNQRFDLMQIPDRLLEHPAWRKFYDEQMTINALQ